MHYLRLLHSRKNLPKLESFCYWNTSNFLITPVFVSKSEVHTKVDRLLTDLTAQQSSTIAWWDSNKMPLVFTTLLELTISKNCSWLEIEVDWINKMTPFKYICIGFLFGAHGEPHFYCMGIVNENSIWHQFISINFVQTNEILFVIWHLNAGLLVALQNAPDRSLIVVFTDNGTKVNSH